MRGILQERFSRLHGFKDACFSLLTQIILDLAAFCDQTDQGLGLMSIELVRNENPGSFWILINHLGDVRCKVGFRSRGSNGR